MVAGRGDLLRDDVDAAELRIGVIQADPTQHRPHAAADLQQPFAGMQDQVVSEQVLQQIGLLQPPPLLPFAGAVDVGVVAHGLGWLATCRLGRTRACWPGRGRPASSRIRTGPD